MGFHRARRNKFWARTPTFYWSPWKPSEQWQHDSIIVHSAKYPLTPWASDLVQFSDSDYHSASQYPETCRVSHATSTSNLRLWFCCRRRGVTRAIADAACLKRIPSRVRHFARERHAVDGVLAYPGAKPTSMAQGVAIGMVSFMDRGRRTSHC